MERMHDCTIEGCTFTNSEEPHPDGLAPHPLVDIPPQEEPISQRALFWTAFSMGAVCGAAAISVLVWALT